MHMLMRWIDLKKEAVINDMDFISAVGDLKWRRSF